MISDSNPQIQALSRNASSRIRGALAESTTRSYDNMFRVFLAFTIFAKFPLSAISADHILCFLECLASNNVSHSAIVNYLSATKTKMAMFGLSTASFTDPRLRYFSRSLARNASLKVTLKSIIDIPILTQISHMCESMYMGFVYKAAILLSFFSFLRISNLVPHSIAKFDTLKHLARGDIFFAPPGAHILLKWSKTLQMNNSVRLLKIPQLGASPICPIKALTTLLSLTPSGPNRPLFQIKLGHQWVPLSDTRLRKQFSIILARLQLAKSNITFHSLRRSGATWAFNAKVPLQNIQSHGTWTSECVWSYITQDHQASDAVALTFQRSLLL